MLTEFSVIDSPVGPLRLECTNEAITTISFTQAPLTEAPYPPLLHTCAEELTAFFQKKLPRFSVPLAPEGTPFQQRVWRALQTIPYGKTLSYRDLAQAIDNPKAMRAVGQANGRNPIAILIPCHRVIAHDGTIGGYAGGLPAKRWLLAHEAQQHPIAA